MFEGIKKRLDIRRENRFEKKLRDYLEKAGISKRSREFFLENIDISINIIKNFSEYQYNMIFAHLSEYIDIAILKNREDFEKLYTVLSIYHYENYITSFFAIFKHVGLDYLDLLLEIAIKYNKDSILIFSTIISTNKISNYYDEDIKLALEISKYAYISWLDYTDYHLFREDLNLILDICKLDYDVLHYNGKSLKKIISNIGSFKTLLHDKKIYNKNMELLLKIISFSYDTKDILYYLKTLDFFEENRVIIELTSLVDLYERVINNDYYRKKYNLDEYHDLFDLFLHTIMRFVDSYQIKNVRESENYLDSILDLIDMYKKYKINENFKSCLSVVNSIDDLLILKIIFKQNTNEKNVPFLISLFNRLKKEEKIRLKDIGNLEEFITQIIRFYNSLDLNLPSVLFILQGRILSETEDDYDLIININSLNLFLNELIRTYKGISNDEINKFISFLQTFGNIRLFIGFNDLMKKLYLYKLADNRIINIMRNFEPIDNLDERKTDLIAKIKNYPEEIGKFIYLLIKNGIIENIEDIDPESIELLLEKNKKARVIKNYEDIAAALSLVLKRPEKSRLLLKYILIDMNQNLRIGGGRDIEAFLPQIQNLIIDIFNSYNKLNYESKLYLDAIIKKLNIGDLRSIETLRQLAMDLASACRPLTNYRNNIHNSPNPAHYYIAKILRVYFKNQNTNLVKALCERYKNYGIVFSNDSITYYAGQDINVINLKSLEDYVNNKEVLRILLELSRALAQTYNINTRSVDEIIENIERSIGFENINLMNSIRSLLNDYSEYMKGKINIQDFIDKIREIKNDINSLLLNPNIQNKFILYKFLQLLESKEYNLALKFKDTKIRNIEDLRSMVRFSLHFLDQVENHKYIKISRESFKEFLNSQQYFQLSNAVYNLNRYFNEVIEPLIIKEFRSSLKERGLNQKEVEEYLSLIVRESVLLPLYELTAKIDYHLRNIKHGEEEAISRHQNILKYREESREEELQRELKAYRRTA